MKRSKPEKTFFCDYEDCNRSYSSTLALNLHIKTKHNGGTKKERDAYAVIYLFISEINYTCLVKRRAQTLDKLHIFIKLPQSKTLV